MQRMKRSHAIIAGFAGASILAFWAATAGADPLPPAQPKAGHVDGAGIVDKAVVATSSPATLKPAVRIIPLHTVATAQKPHGGNQGHGMKRAAGG